MCDTSLFLSSLSALLVDVTVDMVVDDVGASVGVQGVGVVALVGLMILGFSVLAILMLLVLLMLAIAVAVVVVVVVVMGVALALLLLLSNSVRKAAMVFSASAKAVRCNISYSRNSAARK